MFKKLRKHLPMGLSILAIVIFLGPVLNFFAPRPCPLRFSQQAYKLPRQSFMATSGKVNAVPSFARKFNASCTTCHSVTPYLNRTGREFLERGFLMPDEDGKIDHDMQQHQRISHRLSLEKIFPFSLRIKSFPFDIKTDKKVRFRPLHEAELLALGNMFDIASFMVELEFEDDEGFSPSFHGRFGIHPSPYFNIAGGYGSVFSTDPYNSMASGGHSLTIGNKTLLHSGYKSEISLAQSAQFVNFYGRAGIVYYSAGLSSTPGQKENFDFTPRFGQARLALDLSDNIEIGAFGFGGLKKGVNTAADITLFRAGADLNLSISDFNVLAMFSFASDQKEGQENDINLGGSAEFFYVWRKNGNPLFLPLLRLDGVTTNDANDFTLSLFAGISHYMRENFRLGVEGSVDLAKPDTNERQWRTTLFADFVF